MKTPRPSHRAFERRSVGKLRRVVAIEEIGSEDCHGHALWALGLWVSQAGQVSFQMLAEELFRAGAARTKRSAKATSRTSSTPAARCCSDANSSSPTR